MSTSLNQIYNKIEEDRDATLDLLGAIIECIRLSNKLLIRGKDHRVHFEIPAYPNDVVYFNTNHIFIPERLLENHIGGDTYLGIEDMVNILKNTRIKHKKILSDEFYAELEISTPVGRTTVDTLCFNYRPIA